MHSDSFIAKSCQIFCTRIFLEVQKRARAKCSLRAQLHKCISVNGPIFREVQSRE